MRSIAPLICCILALVACGPLEPGPPLDADGEPIPTPPPGEPWLKIADVSPSGETWSRRPSVAITFSEHINPHTILSYAAASLGSGGLSVGGQVRHIMVRRQLIWRADRDLTPNLDYTLRLGNLAGLRSATGAPLWPQLPTITRRAQADADDPWRFDLDDRPRTFDADVAPLLEARCASCHADPQWGLNPLSYEALLELPSAQTERRLVRPLDPARSYLMHKIIPDYVDRRFTVQPPPWGDDPTPLTVQEQWTIERWIAGGARR